MAEEALVTVVDVVEAEEALAGAGVVVEALGAVAEEEEDEVVSDGGDGGAGNAVRRLCLGLGFREEEITGSPSLTAPLPCRRRVPVWRQPGSWSGRQERKPVGEECDGRTPSA